MGTLYTLIPLVFIVCLILSASFVLRVVLAISFEKYTELVRRRPLLHVGWLLLTLITFFQFIPTVLHWQPQRRPGIYGRISGDLYWRMIISSSAKELMRRDGIIFFFRSEHHGLQFLAIREEEAAATRQEGLRKVVDDFSLNNVWRNSDGMLPLLNLATRTDHGDLEAFREWWKRERDSFVFDEEAHKRLRDYNFGEGNPDERLSRYEARLGEERELILRGKYRTNLKPREPAPPHPPAQY
jgi:hypothetical protein